MSSVASARPVAVGVGVAVLLVLGAALLPGDDDRSGSGPAPATDRTGPLAVLRAWDRERAAAWRDGDLEALGDLYTPGSRAGAADRAMLAAYVDRGLRVTGMRMQVAAAGVARARDDRLVLVVTDRLASAEARGPGGTVPLPADRWSSRRVVLVRGDERWQVAQVTAQRRPEATTASTSGSENS